MKITTGNDVQLCIRPGGGWILEFRNKRGHLVTSVLTDSLPDIQKRGASVLMQKLSWRSVEQDIKDEYGIPEDVELTATPVHPYADVYEYRAHWYEITTKDNA